MQIKVVCLNLWEGGKLFPGILQFLRSQNADILLLQEVYGGTDSKLSDHFRSIEVLKTELPEYKYYDFAPAMLDIVTEGKIESGNAIFSKYPIVDSDAAYLAEEYGERDAYDPAHFPTTPRNLQHVVIDADGAYLNIFNFQGVWDLNGDNYSPQRKKMSDIIIQQTDGKEHVILAGDTNARPTNQAIRNIERHLHSVFGSELASTFNMRRKTNPGYATSSVDMVFVSHDLEVIEKDCPDVDISDHLPLVVKLTVH